MFKKWSKIILITGLAFFWLGGCAKSVEKQNIDESKVIVVGTTIGDFGDMIKESITPILEKKGYQVKLIEFSEYILPNKSLAEGSIDVNVFQHRPFFYNFIKEHNLDLIETFEVPTALLAIYSGQLTNLNTDKKEIRIGIPNDPSNIARSLVLLQDIAYIKLKPNINPISASIKDIASYSKPIKFVELEAAQLPRSRNDLDFVIINGNYARSSGIDLNSALYKEKGSTYINIAAIRPEDKDSQWIKDLETAYYSEEFKQYIYKKFKDYQFPAKWATEK